MPEWHIANKNKNNLNQKVIENNLLTKFPFIDKERFRTASSVRKCSKGSPPESGDQKWPRFFEQVLPVR